MALYHEFLTDDRDFKNYDDLKANCRFKTPENFNFAYDIVDRYTITEPGKRAMVWIDDNGEEKTATESVVKDDMVKKYAISSSQL